MQRLLLVLLGVCSLTWAIGFPVPSGAETTRQQLNRHLRELKKQENQFEKALDSAQSRKSEAEEKFQEKKREENNLLDLIARYQELQRASKDRLEALRHREEAAKQRLEEIDRKFRQANERLQSREKLLLTRLRNIYKQGELMQTRTLMEATDLSEFLTNYQYYRRLVRHDKELINQYRESRQRIKTLKERRRRVYETRKTLRQDVEQTLQKRKELMESRRDFLREVRNEKNLYKRRLRELEQRQQRLKEKVITLQRERTSTKRKIERITGQFGQLKGQLPWPVDSREVLRPYGTWRENGIVHNNDGIDIAVNSGAPVESVASGKVVFASTYQGIGKVVIVRHNDNFLTLYGSLVDVSVREGDSVDEGTHLGSAGVTAGMDHPRLYFQVFEGKQTLNPADWLR